MNMKLELVTIAVSDVDQAKDFYVKKLGFHEDVDQNLGHMRFVQVTPPGSACSISFGEGITDAKPGSAAGMLLAVDDCAKVRDELESKGVEISKAEKKPWGSIHADFLDPDGNAWTLQQKPDRS
jgi:catechol 2,3-dioxygenase-like lactoylglutathione lyase family enzyme